MKIFQWFKRGTKHQAQSTKHLDSPWGRFGIPDATVAAYLQKNDAYELNVPLQIAQRILDEEASEFIRQGSANALDLARAQGLMMGVAKVALELSRVVKAKDRFIVAGGLLEGGEDK